MLRDRCATALPKTRWMWCLAVDNLLPVLPALSILCNLIQRSLRMLGARRSDSNSSRRTCRLAFSVSLSILGSASAAAMTMWSVMIFVWPRNAPSASPGKIYLQHAIDGEGQFPVVHVQCLAANHSDHWFVHQSRSAWLCISMRAMTARSNLRARVRRNQNVGIYISIARTCCWPAQMRACGHRTPRQAAGCRWQRLRGLVCPPEPLHLCTPSYWWGCSSAL